MHISIFHGDIADVQADAVCTSTNPRLSLMMGTGASIRDRGGFEVLRACEQLIEQERNRSGRSVLPVGSAHATTAGALPFKLAIHCIASDANHHVSSPDIVRSCVRNALRIAAENGCASIAMPVFAAGHARLRFDLALKTMLETLRDSDSTVNEVTIAVNDLDRAEAARAIVASST
ncbi:MAG TPA: macro domain-containing protein [Thermoanaerobaculia bacterium]|nr:macro domain-containing protein [Thermoanaerobaculia bacterium]